MKRIMMMVALAAFMVAALSVSALSAFAASPGETACTDSGGDWTSVGRGQFICDDSSTVDGPTTDTGNDPQTTNDTDTQKQHGQGIGGGAKDEPVVLHCEYSQSGNLFDNKSDEGCPDPEPTS
jgi:hypothetical protein